MKQLRSAIYTRVSTDQGLEQEFNSLHNQREACEAYVKSQAHEGWRCLPTPYDDGGFSGGSMERPALQKLLADIKATLIDIVVVYKVDRLTRSLADFAKLVELFDQHGVSFVSVTQAFNTTTSMGRLTLNVLLSFAQFEREVTAERIRDKIAASKKKGLRVGGPVPLGYDVVNKKLVINPEEAERVRLIFRRYLDLGSLLALLIDLRKRGITTKLTRLSDGRSRGGIPFTKGPLAYLLKNRVYVGEIVHKGNHYPGEHESIPDRELFEAVQQKLNLRARAYRHTRINNASLLTGLLYDDRGNRMTPSTTKKGNVRYRYYVSSPMLEGRHEEAGPVKRVPAHDIEQVVLAAIADWCGEEQREKAHIREDQPREMVVRHLTRAVVGPSEITLTLRRAPDDIPETVKLPWTPNATTRQREILLPAENQGPTTTRPIRAETRSRLIAGIAKARIWVDELIAGRVKDTAQIAAGEHLSERSVRMTLGLAFLSPAIVHAVVAGSVPDRIGVDRLSGLSANWAEQISGNGPETNPSQSVTNRSLHASG